MAQVAVYGASGYTGRLVVEALGRSGAELLLAGRDPEKLRRVAAELGVDAAVRGAAVDDRDALRHAFGDAAAVVNCAGPFTRLGEPVARAAVETGTHYVDTSGEQPYMQRIFERLDDAARAAEVAVVPAMGFDYVPGDLLAHLVAAGHEPLRELVVAYAVSGFGPTRGTLRSTLEIVKGGDLAYEDGEWRPAGRGTGRATFAFPEPIGRRPVTKYPSGEIVTVPRHVRTRKVTSLITTTTFVPVEPLAPIVPLAMAGFGLVAQTPLRSVIDEVIGRLPEGPSPEERARARFTVAVVAYGEDGRVGRGVVRGGDVYGLTAAIAAHGATLMAAEGYDRAGVLPPAAAYDPAAFLDHLAGHGVSYEVPTAGRAGAAA